MCDSYTVLIDTRATPGTGGKCRIPDRVGSTSRTVPSDRFACI